MTTGHIPEGSVVITPTEIYAKVNTLTDVVTQLLARDEADQIRQADQKEAAVRRETEVAKREAEIRAEVTAIKLDVAAIRRTMYFISGLAAGAGGLMGGYLPTILGG